jgi:hypothetical protein
MTDVDFFSPSDSVDPTKVRRAKDGRPYVKVPCPGDCGGSGRVPGVRKGFDKQCPKCKGKGMKEVLFTRATSFVGVLDDRSNLEKWQKRIILVGLAASPWLVNEIYAVNPDDKDALDSFADLLFEAGEGHVKAQKGTDLHTLTEYVDKGWDLPATLTDYDTGQERPVTLQDRADMAAWRKVTNDLGVQVVGSELFVVQDDYQIGGTYDRLVLFPKWRSGGRPMVNPCDCGKAVILDLKTGRIDYGAGKIAQQLAVYANSKDYDPVTGERTDQDVCTHFGIVVHLPQGTGEATVHVVDLVAGWEAVKLSSQVREHRRMAKNMIWSLEDHPQLTQ